MSNNSSIINNNNNTSITSLSNLDMMKALAQDQQSLELVQQLTSSKITDQLKVFLIAQARNELTRVIKLTQVLDRIEDNFIKKTDDAIIDDSLTLKQYGEIISIITNLLDRSNNIISQVLKDDSLMAIVNTTVYASNNSVSQSMSVVSQLKDAQSRERVRSVIQQILNNTKDYQPTDNVIEYNEEKGDNLNE